MAQHPPRAESQPDFLIQDGIPSATQEQQINIPIPDRRGGSPHINAGQHEVPSAQRLPPEMLSEIFLFYHAMARYDYFTRRHPSPLILCHVCSVWRQVAQTTPKLWTSLSLTFRTGTFGDHVSLASAWLDRARPHPVSVSIDSYHPRLQVPNRIVECILPSVRRLKFLSLKLPLASFEPLIDVHPGPMDLLESMYLEVMPRPYPHPKKVRMGPIVAFQAAPHLRRLTLSCSHGTRLLKFLHMPWSKLTELRITNGLPASICRHILRHCRGLVECSLNVEPWNIDDHVHDASIAVLPKLHKLEITFDGYGHASSFFQPLTLPALKAFELVYHDGSEWSEPIFLQLLSRSSMCLERLHLGMVHGITPNELVHFLEHIPSLVHLDLELLSCFDDTLVETLCYNELDPHPLLPNLQVFSVFDTGLRWDDDDRDILIEAMIRSRWWSDADLARVSPRVSRWKCVSMLLDDRKFNPMVLERLNECCQEGLDLGLGGKRLGSPRLVAIPDLFLSPSSSP